MSKDKKKEIHVKIVKPSRDEKKEIDNIIAELKEEDKNYQPKEVVKSEKT